MKKQIRLDNMSLLLLKEVLWGKFELVVAGTRHEMAIGEKLAHTIHLSRSLLVKEIEDKYR